MEERYHQLDHTADVAFEVRGKTLKNLFENAAYALYEFMFSKEEVFPEITVDVEITGIDTEDLLIRWLNELIFISEMDELVFSEFRIVQLRNNHVAAEASGERYKPDKHGSCNQVKAATYHNIAIQKDDDGFRSTIVFDV